MAPWHKDYSCDRSTPLLQVCLRAQWSYIYSCYINGAKMIHVQMSLLNGKYSPCHSRPIGISEWLIEVQVIQADIIWHVPKEGEAEEHHISLLYAPGI